MYSRTFIAFDMCYTHSALNYMLKRCCQMSVAYLLYTLCVPTNSPRQVVCATCNNNNNKYHPMLGARSSSKPYQKANTTQPSFARDTQTRFSNERSSAESHVTVCVCVCMCVSTLQTTHMKASVNSETHHSKIPSSYTEYFPNTLTRHTHSQMPCI